MRGIWIYMQKLKFYIKTYRQPQMKMDLLCLMKATRLNPVCGASWNEAEMSQTPNTPDKTVT